MGLRILVPRPRLRPSLVRANKFVWAALGIALWGSAYTLLGASGYAGVVRARAEIVELEEAVVAAAGANRDLEAEIAAVKTDPATIERLAREEFFLARPGETIYLLPPPPLERGGAAIPVAPPLDVTSIEDARRP